MKGPADPLLALSFFFVPSGTPICRFPCAQSMHPAAFHELPIAVLLAASRNTTVHTAWSQLNPQIGVPEGTGLSQYLLLW